MRKIRKRMVSWMLFLCLLAGMPATAMAGTNDGLRDQTVYLYVQTTEGDSVGLTEKAYPTSNHYCIGFIPNALVIWASTAKRYDVNETPRFIGKQYSMEKVESEVGIPFSNWNRDGINTGFDINRVTWTKLAPANGAAKTTTQAYWSSAWATWHMDGVVDKQKITYYLNEEHLPEGLEGTGEAVYTTEYKRAGEAVTLPNLTGGNASEDEKTFFMGWSTDVNAVEPMKAEDIPVQREDINLYAVYGEAAPIEIYRKTRNENPTRPIGVPAEDFYQVGESNWWHYGVFNKEGSATVNPIILPRENVTPSAITTQTLIQKIKSKPGAANTHWTGLHYGTFSGDFNAVTEARNAHWYLTSDDFLSKFTAELVTHSEEAAGKTIYGSSSEQITYPADGKLSINYTTTGATLLYKITVAGTNTQYTLREDVKDQPATTEGTEYFIAKHYTADELRAAAENGGLTFTQEMRYKNKHDNASDWSEVVTETATVTVPVAYNTCTVTFAVEHGTFEEGTDRMIYQIPVGQTLSGAGISIPDSTNMLPAVGYTSEGAAWKDNPNATAPITEDKVYTYSFKKEVGIYIYSSTVTFHVVNGTFSGGETSISADLEWKEAEDAPVLADFIPVATPNAGYRSNGSWDLNPAEATLSNGAKLEFTYTFPKRHHSSTTPSEPTNTPETDMEKNPDDVLQPTDPENESDDGKFPFDDVRKTDWFFDDVSFVWEQNLMQGVALAKFGPNLPTTRGMIVTILYRLENQPEVVGSCPYTDVQTGSYYKDAIIWAVQNGIAFGYSDTQFGPEDNITREQIGAILYRYADFKAHDTTKTSTLAEFTDAHTVGAWALDAVAWANAEGFICGTDEAKLEPQKNASREQVAAILHRYCNAFIK